ncbi:MAG TPA: Crp/Fnr family transcriptional regulator [Aeromonadales bacterium]|nr:Crp/Fnr family transcriptional regulator [Aeromonadales bacterium]
MEKSQIQQFLNCVKQDSNIIQEEFTSLLKLFELRTYKNKDHIIDPTEEKSNVFFILSGLIRYYYLAEDGKEWNKAFIAEDMMCTSFSKDFLGLVSPYGIQAIEKTTILIANFSEFEMLYEKSPRIERLGRKLIERILISKMKRERSFLQNSAKMRYTDFAKENPRLFQRIPQYHLASYLGITEASLSRISNELY